ncbi:MAG: penicillin acylase family protein, partial [Bacteroidetes bacterium]|nr:penicillin acylase family protein [Bacteroidota bacterium]
MKVVPFIVSLVITIALIVCLDRQWGTVPPIGRFVSPQHGFWQNAEAVDENFNASLIFPELHDKSTVYFDGRLVPHVFAENETDVYFIQGYLHAKFRLWQMEFQVMASAGRLSEVVGDKTINYDRRKRRLGMGYAAEKALQEMENDSTTKSECDAYTAGVNAYISNMKESELPIEYKLLNYKPEKWTNLKTAFFLKYMSLELAGGENDFEYTNAKNIFGLKDFELLYPSSQDSVDPIIPKGYVYPKPGVNIVTPSTVDSLYLAKTDSTDIVPANPDPANGSNNWAVGGKKTKSGRPILCN